ncbi:hypothetical protein [Spirochaeta dissipatitropha]
MSDVKEKKTDAIIPVTLRINQTNVPFVGLAAPDEFVQVVSRLQPDYVFWDVNEGLKGTGGILNEGVMLTTTVDGYNDYAELESGYKLGFLNGIQYRDSIIMGTRNFKEYQALMESGYSNIDEFREVTKTDLPDIYIHWMEHVDNLLLRKELPTCNNLSEFSLYLEEAGLSACSTEEILSIITAGFSNILDYKEAKECGFTDAATFFHAREYGIKSRNEYKELEISGIQSVSRWKQYKQDSDTAKAEFTDLLGKHLYILYLTESLESTWSLKSIQQYIERNIINPYQMSGGIYCEIARSTGEKPMTALTMHPDICDMVISIDDQTVIRRTLSDEEIETANLDLCNIVLYGIDGLKEERIGDVAKALTIINKLREFGTKEINVFADSSFEHYLTESEIQQVKQACDNWTTAIYGTPADAYLIDHARQYPSFIVTNDHFSTYLDEKSPWIYENIPRLLVPYSFDNEGNVSFGRKQYELQNKD